MLFLVLRYSEVIVGGKIEQSLRIQHMELSLFYCSKIFVQQNPHRTRVPSLLHGESSTMGLAQLGYLALVILEYTSYKPIQNS